MAMANKYGKTAPSMRATGDLTKLAVKESSGTLMATFLKVNG
jgi:hypothetical protein